MLTTSSGPVAPEGSTTEWVQAHEALSRLARERAAADAEEGRWLLAALRSAAHVHLGFGTFAEYVERLFGYKPRSTQEKLRVAEALEELPAAAAALKTGALNWSALRELTRVAVPGTEHEWLEVARGKTVHQLEALVAGKPRGARPSSAVSADVRAHVLRFEIAPETWCLFRQAMIKLERDSGTSLDDDSALMLMARHVLGGSGEEGRAAYQIALSVCSRCSQGFQQTNAELVPVAPEIVAMAECDAQHLGVLPTAVTPVNEAARSSESDCRAHEAYTGTRTQAEANNCAHDAHTNAHTGARVEAEADRAAHDADANARVKTESITHDAHRGARARQSIPPATRRAVLRRDQHRCSAPGCRNFRFLDLHHIQLSSEGGCNRPSNILTLCGVHHRAAHRGALLVSGSVPEGVTFRHADASTYGQPLNALAVEVDAKAFAALRNLGFREGETRRVLTEIRNQPSEQLPSLESIVLDALARLTSSSKNPAPSPAPSVKRR